jgi:hypothetical protein
MLRKLVQDNKIVYICIYFMAYDKDHILLENENLFLINWEFNLLNVTQDKISLYLLKK